MMAYVRGLFRGRAFVGQKLALKTLPLKEAIREAGEDTSIRVWCEIYADEILARWEKYHSLRAYKGGPERLVGKNAWLISEGGTRNERVYTPPVGDDHGQLWGINHTPLVYTMQPYGRVDMNQLVQWALPLGLRIDVLCEESWHFPTRTVLIEITTPASRVTLDKQLHLAPEQRIATK